MIGCINSCFINSNSRNRSVTQPWISSILNTTFCISCRNFLCEPYIYFICISNIEQFKQIISNVSAIGCTVSSCFSLSSIEVSIQRLEVECCSSIYHDLNCYIFFRPSRTVSIEMYSSDISSRGN